MRTRGRSGFTTIELMVVLVIIVVLSTLVVVSMGPVLADARLRSGCRTVISTLNYARNFAVTHRTSARVVFDREQCGVSVQVRTQDENGKEQVRVVTTPSGRYRKLPRGLKIASIRKRGSDAEESFAGFSELGQSDGAVITLVDSNGKERVISVDPVTGRSAIVKTK